LKNLNTGSLTIEAWIKPDSVLSVGQIASRYGNSDGGYQLGIYNGKLRMDILHTGSSIQFHHRQHRARR